MSAWVFSPDEYIKKLFKLQHLYDAPCTPSVSVKKDQWNKFTLSCARLYTVQESRYKKSWTMQMHERPGIKNT